jgi:hypothetical protein
MGGIEDLEKQQPSHQNGKGTIRPPDFLTGSGSI